MNRIKDDAYYLEKILKDIDFILVHMENVSKNQLQENEVLLDSMQFRLIQISENASKLSSNYKQRHTEIDWHEIYGLRNWLVHDYGNVDYEIVFSTLVKDIKPLKERLLKPS